MEAFVDFACHRQCFLGNIIPVDRWWKLIDRWHDICRVIHNGSTGRKEQGCYNRLVAITKASQMGRLWGRVGTRTFSFKVFPGKPTKLFIDRRDWVWCQSNTLFSVRMNVFLRPPSLRPRVVWVSMVECFGVRTSPICAPALYIVPCISGLTNLS